MLLREDPEDPVTETYLCWTVEESRGGSLWLWVRQLHSELKAQRQVACHEEPGHTTHTHVIYVGVFLAIRAQHSITQGTNLS